MDRQIQLSRSVLWWYIAPGILGANLVFIGTGASRNESLGYGIFTLLFAWGVYALNMRAVTKHLVPHREELANVLTQLENPTSDTGHPTGLPVEPGLTRRETFLVWGLILTISAVGVAGAFLSEKWKYPKRAPFSGVRWEGDESQVKIGEEWFVLLSIDGIPADTIVAFSQRRYWLGWRKRFEEDLVEVLDQMGHPPGDSVRLVVRPVGSATTWTLERVPMTEANRRAIYQAARAREGR
jgi:hypothetical protein